MYYTVIKHSDHLRTLDKCRKHSPAARVFYISLVFSNARRVLSQCNTRLRLLYLLNIYLAISCIYISNFFVCMYINFFAHISKWVWCTVQYKHKLSRKLHAGNESKNVISCQVACCSKICTTSNNKVECNMWLSIEV